MKRSWIVRMDEKAVSPVIATILMVAITVVLAAVLYVMITGLIGGSASAAPAMSLSVRTPTSLNQWIIAIDSVDHAVSLSSYQVQLQNISNSDANMCGSTPATLQAGNVCTSGGVVLSYQDSNNDGRFSGGDTFTISQVASGMSYKFFVFWKTTGNEITDKTIG